MTHILFGIIIGGLLGAYYFLPPQVGYNLVMRTGIGLGLAMAYLHISLAPLAQSVVDLDRYLFPVSLAKQYSFLTDWRLPEREIELPKPKKEAKAPTTDYDLDKLAKAVAMHETLDCGARAGSALVNNCFGIMQWDSKGRRSYKRFKSKEDSYKDFKRIWSSYYKDFPNYALAKKYSGDDRTTAWLTNVTRYYHEL